MKETVILSGVRTPFGKFGGSLKNISSTDLGAIVIKEAVNRSGVLKDDIDYVLMGQVLQAGVGQIPSRQASIKAGLDWNIPSDTINKVCASSFRAVTLADQMIRSGNADVVVAGGMESMSNAPYLLRDYRFGKRMFNGKVEDAMIVDGLWDAFYDQHMVVNGGYGADKYNISRESQDEWAVRSQQRATIAIESGVMSEEIVPVEIESKKSNETIIIETDEGPRKDTTYEKISKMKGLFVEGNTITAANAPSTNDGASALLIASRKKAEELNAKVLATIVDHTAVAIESRLIASAPGHAINELLKRNNLTSDDIDLFEINEAFAAVTLVSQQMVGIDEEKINVNGGAIAYGHPIGASGGRIITTLVHEMRRRKAKYGVAAICSGAAQGDAILIRCDY